MKDGKNEKQRLKNHFTALLITTFLIVIIVSGEIFVRATDIDWRYPYLSLYYNNVDVSAHEAVKNPDLLYRLKPGTHLCDDHTIEVNSLGFRGPERAIEKEPGEYRIIVLGGSNAYGVGTTYNNSWPAMLERELHQQGATKVSVWNLGVCAYVGLQIATLGYETLKSHDPDLVIVALGNTGMRPFLEGTKIEPYFNANPELWFEMIIHPYFDILPDELQNIMIRDFRFYRYTLIALTRAFGFRSQDLEHHEIKNAAAIRQFLAKAKAKTETAVFLYPGVKGENYKDYLSGEGVAVLALDADDLDIEYAQSHPLPHVARWYGLTIARRLIENFDIPIEGDK